MTIGRTWAAALLVAGTITVPAVDSLAAPPRVKGYACPALARSTPVNSIWNAVFQGQREGPFDMLEWTHEVRCFKTEANCKAWVYWIQSDWPLMNQVRRCRRGLP